MNAPNLLFRSAAAATIFTVASSSAHALLITFGGQSPLDNSGLTSSLIDPSNMMPADSGFFVETFDVATYTALPSLGFKNDGLGGPGTSGTTDPEPIEDLSEIVQPVDAEGGPECSINSWGGPAITATGGGFGVRKGSTGGAARPANDETCYAYGPKIGGGTPAAVKIDYSPILTVQGPGVGIDYLGLYYGSIDTYNNIAFYSGDELLTTDSGLLMDGILSGSEILAAEGGSSGNQTQRGSNVYVNLFFDANEMFTAFEFRTTGIAFEFDNVVVGLSNRTVPIPSPIALMLTGLTIVTFRKRKGRR